MKKRMLTIVSITIFLTVSTLFINPGNASNQIAYTIQSSGTITDSNVEPQSLKVILRHLGNPMPQWTNDINGNVDNWVRSYPWIEGGAVVIEVGDVAQILWFNQSGWKGHSFNTTNGVISNECPWTFNQLQTLIDRFHYHNVRVVLGIIGFAKPGSDWTNSDIWGWVNATRRELLFKHPDSSIFGIKNNQFFSPAPLNWFANFTSYDPASGATKGQTLYDLFITRLGETIDAGLQWDGIFGSEGWGSVGILGGGSNSTWIDASADALDQWTNSPEMFHPKGFPSDWTNYTALQKVTWIQNNANMDWRGYWGYRYAKDLFANVHDMIESKRPSEWFVGDIFSPDVSWMDPNRGATWGGWSSEVGYNATWLGKYCSSSSYLYFVDSETCFGGQLGQQAELGKIQAYTAASVKGSDPRFHTIIGMQLYQLSQNPLWIAKQEWLAQAQDYVWVNGSRYSAVDRSYCMIQYPDGDNGYLRSIWNDLFAWISNMVNVMNNVEPINLGPTYFAGIRTAGVQYWDLENLNYTFAQWAFADNYQNNPQYFNTQMTALYIPSTWYAIQGGSLTGWQNTTLNNFKNGEINVIFTINNWGNSQYSMLGQVAFGTSASEEATMAMFHLQNQEITGSDNNVKIPSSIDDPTAGWLASGYLNKEYTISGMYGPYRGYKAANGYHDISTFTQSGASNLGIYYNSTSGRFLYLCLTSTANMFQNNIPSEIINRGINWASNSPINSTDALADYKVFSKTDGSIIVPMMNHRDMGSSDDWGVPMTTTLSFDSAKLGLDDIANYNIYWASNPSGTITASNWNSVQVSLIGMADVLVIQPTSA
jgi:hypothetical protein